MPFTYEYECECGTRWDMRRRASERDELATCPDCGHAGHALFSVTKADNIIMPTARFHDRIGKSEVLHG